jgi:hypothetical protein
VPDNVRDVSVKAHGRPVPQKTYRHCVGQPFGAQNCSKRLLHAMVRVKRCGKSAPRWQRCRWQGKPHTEQDQIGREAGAKNQAPAAHRPDAARRFKQLPEPPGRSLMSVRGNAAPRGMTAPGCESCTEFGLQVLLPNTVSSNGFLLLGRSDSPGWVNARPGLTIFRQIGGKAREQGSVSSRIGRANGFGVSPVQPDPGRSSGCFTIEGGGQAA